MTDLVLRARDGDRTALDGLVRTSLPLVYSLVRRALGDDVAVDDVVQDVMLRMLRNLSGLREPERFRAWLVSITLHRISTHESTRAADARHTAPLDETLGVPDPAAGIEGAAALRADLERQRRQVMRAGRWLDPGNRGLLLVRWLLAAGEVSQAEAAEILGVGPGHARVRLQRLRNQLEAGRAVVTALEAVPRCERLGELVARWDGTPSPLWRKRIARHVRSCPACGAATAGMISTERVLRGLALLPVPAALAAAVIAKGLTAAPVPPAAPAAAGLLSRLAGMAGAHPVITTVTASAMAVGGVMAGGVALPDARPADATVAATTPRPLSGPPAGTSPGAPAGPPSAGSASAGPPSAGPPSAGPSPAGPPPSEPSPVGGLPRGRLSLESAAAAGQFVTVAGADAVLARVGPGSGARARRWATFEVVPGLADPRCSSLRAADGSLLRHASWRLRLDRDDGTVLFRRDATFCVRPGATGDSVSLEASNYPGYFVRRVGGELRVDQSDGTRGFRDGSSFFLRTPWA